MNYSRDIVFCGQRTNRGMLLLEQVLSIGLIGIIILFAGLAMTQSIKAHRSSNLSFEAQNLAEDILESYQARGLEHITSGTNPPMQGVFSEQTTYRAEVNVYTLPSSGASQGLTEDDVKGIRVSVIWKDRAGQHQVKSEGLVIRMPR